MLCIERLFHLISIAVDRKDWCPISLSRGGPKISHLAFADDLILFAEANLQQVQVIQVILEKFCASSGKKISKEKTRVLFSRNVGWHTKQQLSTELGFQWVDDLGKYLGVPLLHKRTSKQTFQFVLDKVNQ